jgi:hypothetical protein
MELERVAYREFMGVVADGGGAVTASSSASSIVSFWAWLRTAAER